MRVRSATPDDAEALARLLADYLREGYPGHAGTTAAELRRDVLSGATGHRVLLAERAGAAAGFVAWDPVYDMHWAARGAQVADLYVAPGARGLGLALELLAGVCGAAAREGGVFLRGGAYDRPSTRAFFGRFAVVHAASGETHLSARAFRRLAALAGRPAREILAGLPPLEWNFSE